MAKLSIKIGSRFRIGKRRRKPRAAPERMHRLYQLAFQRQGHQGWWPAETPFEVCVGAILTQNTNWGNVRRAIANLKAAGVLEPRPLYALPEAALAKLIQPAGYYNVKAKRLRAFLRVLVEEHDGELARLFAGETAAVRQRLLQIKGVGAETADSMLLYAGGHLSFVVDAYTRRIFQRHRWSCARTEYDELQAALARGLSWPPYGQTPLDFWQDFHAQLVAIGNTWCRSRNPRCGACPLRSLLPPGLVAPNSRRITLKA